MDKPIDRNIILSIIVVACICLFLATIVAVGLDLLNFMKLEPDVRSKLHVILLAEIVIACVTAFKIYLVPSNKDTQEK